MKARQNPFATDLVLQVRYRPQGLTWTQLLHRLRELDYRAAIVGPEGSGKTTLLEDLRPRLEQLGFRVHHVFLNATSPSLHWSEMKSALTRLTRGNVILLDGAGHMGRLRWMWLRQRTGSAGGLVITAHREGMLPTLVQTRTSVELLSQIVDELLGDRAVEVRPMLPALFAKHAGNVRSALRELYDVFARRDA